MNPVLKYAAIFGPLLTLFCMIGGWVYHVETSLQQAKDVALLREQITALYRESDYLRARAGNLEALFEPWLIQKKVEEIMKKYAPPPPMTRPLVTVPKSVKEDAERWVRAELNRGLDPEQKTVERANSAVPLDDSLFSEKIPVPAMRVPACAK